MEFKQLQPLFSCFSNNVPRFVYGDGKEPMIRLSIWPHDSSLIAEIRTVKFDLVPSVLGVLNVPVEHEWKTKFEGGPVIISFEKAKILAERDDNCEEMKRLLECVGKALCSHPLETKFGRPGQLRQLCRDMALLTGEPVSVVMPAKGSIDDRTGNPISALQHSFPKRIRRPLRHLFKKFRPLSGIPIIFQGRWFLEGEIVQHNPIEVPSSNHDVIEAGKRWLAFYADNAKVLRLGPDTVRNCLETLNLA